MSRAQWLSFSLSAAVVCSCAPREIPGAIPAPVRPPGIYKPYKCIDYLAAARGLQALGAAKGSDVLRKWALEYVAESPPIFSDEMEDGDESPRTRYHGAGFDFPVIVLCRILFEVRPGAEFRSARQGVPTFPDGSNEANWPLQPVHMVDGIPILVVSAYELAGKAESAVEYLDYCISNCAWREPPLEGKSASDIRRAVERVINAGPWRKPLHEFEIIFIGSQAHWHPSHLGPGSTRRAASTDFRR